MQYYQPSTSRKMYLSEPTRIYTRKTLKEHSPVVVSYVRFESLSLLPLHFAVM